MKKLEKGLFLSSESLSKLYSIISKELYTNVYFENFKNFQIEKITYDVWNVVLLEIFKNHSSIKEKAKLIYPDKVRLFDEMLKFMEFELVFDNGEYRLKDLQGGNFGDIESERFFSKLDIIERLEVYEDDYIASALATCLKINNYSSFNDLLEKIELIPDKISNELLWDIAVLDMICSGL